MSLPGVFILLPVKTSRLTNWAVDTLLPRHPPVGINTFMRLRHLLMIHQGLPYPKVGNVMPYHLLRRFMCSYILPQVLHRLVLIPLTRSDARPRLCNHGRAH